MSADNRCIHNASCEIRTPCVENVIMMIDNQLCIYTKKKNKSFTTCRDQSETPCK